VLLLLLLQVSLHEECIWWQLASRLLRISFAYLVFSLSEAQSCPVSIWFPLALALSLWSSMYCSGCERGSQMQPPLFFRSVTF
jgi:hypothetical protein